MFAENKACFQGSIDMCVHTKSEKDEDYFGVHVQKRLPVVGGGVLVVIFPPP